MYIYIYIYIYFYDINCAFVGYSKNTFQHVSVAATATILTIHDSNHSYCKLFTGQFTTVNTTQCHSGQGIGRQLDTVRRRVYAV